eukprot:TRINITY_DN32563_c0_g1_i1.p1 TRINITY_DN32563_c0_g1~~TRINITY_DN32563_c0_g1_i1.p1  ORF type:complete len:441 (+),score=103.92 TRINITY_DN32563_c0_g1_i1:621-1943(+)
MAPRKKSKQRIAAAALDGSDEDTTSTASTASYEHGDGRDAEDVTDEESVMEGHIDSLYEKRASTREAGLKGLINSLTSRVQSEFVEEKYETLTHLFVGVVKKGGTGEVVLAARALGLLGLTLGASDGASHVLEEAAQPLARVAKSASSGAAARVGAIESLALLTFMSADSEETEETMDALWQLCSQRSKSAGKSEAEVRAAALTSWSLLLSAESQGVAGQDAERDLGCLEAALRDGDSGVKRAAAEAVALLHESGQLPSRGASSEEDAVGLDATNGADGEEAGEEEENGGAAVVEQLRALTLQAGRKRQTKQGRSQKASMRQMLSSIEDGGSYSPSSIQLLHGDKLQITSLAQAVQVNAFRKFLAEGFQRHLQDNPLLHQVFEYQPRTSKAVGFRSNAEKRMYRSPNSVSSKARTQARTYSRAHNHAESLGHYGMHGDDN